MSNRAFRFSFMLLVVVVTCSDRSLVGQQISPQHPWSLEELIEHSQDHPRDTFATFAALRLAEQRGVAERNRLIRVLAKRRDSRFFGADPTIAPNWLGFTAGALAVQESLQLERVFADVDSSGGMLSDRMYADWKSSSVKRSEAAAGLWSTSKVLPADKVILVSPWDLAFDPDEHLLIVDRERSRIYRLDQAAKQIVGVRQGFGNYWAYSGLIIRALPNGDLCVVDQWLGTINRIDTEGNITQMFSGPRRTIDADDNITELTHGLSLTPIEKIPTEYMPDESPSTIAIGNDGSMYFAETSKNEKINGSKFIYRIRRRDSQGKIGTIITLQTPLMAFGSGVYEFGFNPEDMPAPADARFDDRVEHLVKDENQRIGCIAVDRNGDLVFSVGRHLKKVESGGNAIAISTRGALAIPSRWQSNMSFNNSIAGDGGPVKNANFQKPSGLAFDQRGNLYVADAQDHCVRKVSSSGQISTIAGTCVPGYSGDGGPASESQLNSPHGLVADANGNLFIADSGNGLVRKVDPSGVITTVAGKFLKTEMDRYTRSSRDGDTPKSKKPTIEIAKLSGPEIPSLPFKKMLGGRRPEVSLLAKMVPRDFYYMHFGSLRQASKIAEYATQIGRHLESQSISRGYTTELRTQLQQQLVLTQELIEDEKFNLQVKEVAIVGSDLYWELGSDFTFLIRYDTTSDFVDRMKSELDRARQQDPSLEPANLEIFGVSCTSLKSKDRSVCAYSAVLQPGVYVRSNSQVALEQIIKTIQAPVFMPSFALSESLDFLYLRTLMPRNAEVEDGFVFLSDDFIRSQIGPRVRIKQSRRLECFSNLYLLQHAGLLHQTQQGKVATNIAELVKSRSLNAKTAESLKCSVGGRYELNGHGRAVCSVHGEVGQMVPCADIKLEKISPHEEFLYEQFVEQYSEYWQEFFDPIGMRIEFTPESYRLETIVLPLIDNSIYTRVAEFTEGAAIEFKPAPLPEETILSIGVAIDKQRMLEKYELDDETRMRQWLTENLGGLVDIESLEVNVHEFLVDGIGDQIQFHVCDSTPNLTFNAAQDLTPGSFGGLLVTSLMSPVYVSVPIKNVEIVDHFFRDIETAASRAVVANVPSGFVPMRHSFATYLVGKTPVRRYSIEVAGVGIHFHAAAIHDQIIVANQPEIIQRLLQSPPQNRTGEFNKVRGNVLMRMLPANWNRLLQSHQLHWESANGDACLQKLGPLTDVARSGYATIDEVEHASQERYGLSHDCPSGGHFEIAKTSTGAPKVICSVHGDRRHPKQLAVPLDNGPLKKLSDELEEITATLEFTPEGLRAVLRIDRSGSKTR